MLTRPAIINIARIIIFTMVITLPAVPVSDAPLKLI